MGLKIDSDTLKLQKVTYERLRHWSHQKDVRNFFHF